jgi:hypothetical protein
MAFQTEHHFDRPSGKDTYKLVCTLKHIAEDKRSGRGRIP